MILQRTKSVASKPARVSPVKSAFGAGIEPPIPASDGTSPVWASAVQKCLTSLRYSPTLRQSARLWIEHHRTATGCPSIDRGDWAMVNSLIEAMSAPLPRKATKGDAMKARKASQPKPVVIVAEEYRPEPEPFTPTPVDRDWAENEFRGVFDRPSARAWWDQVEATARDLRQRGDDVGRFLAQEIDRVVLLASMMGASDATSFERLRDQADESARITWESRGYATGFADGRDECVAFSGQLD